MRRHRARSIRRAASATVPRWRAVRSRPSVLSSNFDIAISAPVLPADTAMSASRFSPHRSPATSRIYGGRSAAPGSACPPSARRFRRARVARRIQRRALRHERRDRGGIAEEQEFALQDDAPTPARRRRRPRPGRGLPPSHRAAMRTICDMIARGPSPRSDSTRPDHAARFSCWRIMEDETAARIAVRRPETTAISGHPGPS